MMSEKNDRDTNYQTLSGTAGQKKIAELVKDIHIAMMTTVGMTSGGMWCFI